MPCAGILEAWSGIFNGLSREKADEFLKPAAPHLIEYIEAIYGDKANQDDGGLGPLPMGLARGACPQLACGACCSSLAGCARGLARNPPEARLRARIAAGARGWALWRGFGCPALRLSMRPAGDTPPPPPALLPPCPAQRCGRLRQRCWATWPPLSAAWGCSSSRSLL